MKSLLAVVRASCLFISIVEAFVVTPPSLRTSPAPSLSARYDLPEWRDLMFNFPGTGSDRRLGTEQGAPPREVCVLPFPYPEVLLQGETKQLRLYEERFVQLFQDAMENHCGVVAMGLLAESGVIQTVPLCEIEAYNRVEGFGIFVTIRVVSRAQLIEINQQDPYIKAICVELSDSLPPNLELPNLVASSIENSVLLLTSMEHRLDQANLSAANKTDDDEDEDAEMQRRINIAQLNDRFYETDDDDDDDDDDDEEDTLSDRKSRFQQAYKDALATDTQGYRVMGQDSTVDRTPQQLCAMSWAAFCTEMLPKEDATFRIQALDSDNLFERLKLASHMLRQKETKLRTKMEKAGLRFKGDDAEGEDKGDTEGN